MIIFSECNDISKKIIWFLYQLKAVNIETPDFIICDGKSILNDKVLPSIIQEEVEIYGSTLPDDYFQRFLKYSKYLGLTKNTKSGYLIFNGDVVGKIL